MTSSLLASRDAIMNALVAQLNPMLVGGANDAGIKSISRKFKTWDQLSDVQTPVMYLLQGQNNYTRTQKQAAPATVIMNVNLFIYTTVLSEDDTVLPSSVLNGILDKLDIALTETYGIPGGTKLGGLVANCWIEGDILYDSGDMDGIGLAIVPLKILIPAFAY